MYSHGFINNRPAVALLQDTERACDKQRTAGIMVELIKATLPSLLTRMIFRYLQNRSLSVMVCPNLLGPTRSYVYSNDIPNIWDANNALATHADGMNVRVLSGSLRIPISRRNKATDQLEPGSRNSE